MSLVPLQARVCIVFILLLDHKRFIAAYVPVYFHFFVVCTFRYSRSVLFLFCIDLCFVAYNVCSYS